MKKVSYKLKIIITIMIVFSLMVSYVNVIPADKKIETVAYKKTPVGAHGRLNVKGTKLVDQYGKEIQFKVFLRMELIGMLENLMLITIHLKYYVINGA